MGIGHYILDGHTPVAVDDLRPWAEWYETHRDEKRVAETTLPSGVWVSTVFLGIDHQWGDGPPLLFETMVFPSHGDFSELDCERCSTWEEAEAQHAAMVAKFSAEAQP